MSQNEMVRFALNNRWLEEQSQSNPDRPFPTLIKLRATDWNRPVRSRMQGGVVPGS